MSFLEWIALGFIALVAAFSLLDRLLARSFNADPAQRWSARDKVIVVTGASAGIGADLCRLWAALGARLVLVARRKDRLQAVADECAKLGALSTSICPADLSDREQCRAMVEKALELEGRIDCLVLNAGVSMSSYLEKVPDPAALQDLMAVNYFGCVYPAFYALPALQQRPFGTAKIVVVSSGTAKVSSPTRTGYAATKCALHGFFDALRIEVARRYGIGVTVVCPPTVATEIHTTRLAGSKSEFEPSTTMSSLQCAQMIVDAVAANKREELFRVTTKVAAVLRPLFPWLTDYVSILAMRKMGLFPENPLDPLDGKNSSDSKKSN